MSHGSNSTEPVKIQVLISAFCVFLASCAAEKRPQVHFEDRPASMSPSAYRPDAEVVERQTVSGGESFLAENQSALNQGIVSLTAAMEAKRRAREAAAASYSSSGTSSGSSSGASAVGGNYEDCVCTSDPLKGRSPSSGYNTIGIRSSRGSWRVTYYFGDTGYLINGGNYNLEGRTINVRFDNGHPVSLKSNAGTGYCTVTSASRG